ncbi:hypothetical protein DYB25_001971 [Aphanomyces astaci]|uniref:EF-hand domain-containing protein n=1 Tax=Aphanomyces astaci TaxID=112090 RepID=A0A397D026_APHAT|nr:hypothetical protein DYB36_001560 [Aphanomyces astaci]RHY37090.1 hypothetical protein DYB25_001971 [Aphanomyces astaci]RHY53156.1 hypothetical protein DYB38_004905 [Aphanomyces astaci]RHY62306.1 hypothetical protein DYB34_001393 [Aphanomyces astaci]RHY68123.1 hypothetical protein DYB30_003543 [Aphanomyces astaci]
MKSTRSPRRGVPKPRVLRSRDGPRPHTSSNPDPPSSVLPALPHSQAVPPLPLLTALAEMPLPHTAPTPSSRHHPKLSERLDANPFLTKADMLKHNQVLAEAHVRRLTLSIADHMPRSDFAQDAVELSSSDIDMLFLVFDSSRQGTIDRHVVVRHLDKMETDREFHTKGTARPCHTSRKQCGAAAYSNMGTADQHQVLRLSAPPPQAADIYSEPRFTPQVPCKQSPRSLAW